MRFLLTKILFGLIFSICWLSVAAQVTVYNSAALTVSSGVTVTLNSSYVNQTNGTSGTITNNGTIDLKNDLTNNTANNVFTAASGTLSFTGTAAQAVSGTNPIYFNSLTINKASNNVTFSLNNSRILNSLTLTSGKIVLGSNTLIMDVASTLSGGNASSYIYTNGSGVLQKNYNSTGSFTYPIGDATEYTPFTMILNSASFAGSDFVSAKVTAAVHPAIVPPDYINRYYTLNSGGFSAINYDVSYYYADTDITGSENYMLSAKYDGLNWQTIGNNNEATNNLTSSTSITLKPTAHDFTGGSPTALPVKLSYFKVSRIHDKSLVQWESATESNLKDYTVQRSRDGADFKDIAELDATGSSVNAQRYTYLDEPNMRGKVYYRLRQNDISGKKNYSSVVFIEFDKSDCTLAAFYNRATNSIVVNQSEIQSRTAIIAVHTIHGQKIFEQTYNVIPGNFSQTVQLAKTISPGLYYVSLVTGSDRYTKEILIKP